MTERFKIIPIVSVVLKKEDSIFLLRTLSDSIFPNVYTLIGGHAEGDETLRQAVVREAFEEVGVTIDPQDLEFIHVSHRKRPTDGQEIAWFVFITECWKGDPYNKEPHKHAELGLFSLSKLPEAVRPSFLVPLFKNLYNYTYSESGW